MTKYHKYKIKLNAKPFPICSVVNKSERQAFKEICNHEINYNPNWGYKLLKKERVV